MRRAYCLIRDIPHYRNDAFCRGLKAAGFKVIQGPPTEYRDIDVLVIWNRYDENDTYASRFERVGGTVLVAENGYLGVDWRGDRWYALARNHHNGAGTWEVGGPERWDGWGVELAEQRAGREIVILPSRGIGPRGVAMPNNWEIEATLAIPGSRIRPHPGARGDPIPLEQDLANAKAAVTWGSGAALKAMLFGVPIYYAMPNWIGAPGATPLAQANFKQPTHGDRLACFRRLAWAMWTVGEIESGEPFVRLCA